MALQLGGFVGKEDNYEGLDKAANSLRARQYQQARLQMQEQGRQAATSKAVEQYTQDKNYLTGTDYDPMISSQIKNMQQTAQGLISKGAALPDVLMAIGKQSQDLAQYKAKADVINNNIENSLKSITPYTGYNKEALRTQARLQAFHNDDGSLKDISQVDPAQDYVTSATKNNPAAVTTSQGIQDFVDKIPMATYDRTVKTTNLGNTRNVSYNASHPFYQSVPTNADGSIKTDDAGNPLRPTVSGEQIGDGGTPLVNPETNQPYIAMDRKNYHSIMTERPDIADYVRGEVMTHFKNAVAQDKTGQFKMPLEGSPQWDAMSRQVLGDELQQRDKSHFNIKDQQSQSPLAVKIDLGNNKPALDAVNRVHQAESGTGDYYIPSQHGRGGSNKQVKTNAVEAIGGIFNNDSDFTNGEHKEMDFGDGKQNVIDVTPFLPGGGLKSGKGEDDVYKSVYYNPSKRSLVVEQEAKTKDADGNKPVTYQEIPESKAGTFVQRIAAANGVDPAKVGGILDKMGYKGAKFNNAANATDIQNQLQEEHQKRITDALSSDKLDDLNGLKVNGGTIQKIDTRTYTFGGLRDKYSVDIKDANGETKSLTFPDKEKLSSFIKQSTPAKTTTTSKKSESGITWQ